MEACLMDCPFGQVLKSLPCCLFDSCCSAFSLSDQWEIQNWCKGLCVEGWAAWILGETNDPLRLSQRPVQHASMEVHLRRLCFGSAAGMRRAWG